MVEREWWIEAVADDGTSPYLEVFGPFHPEAKMGHNRTMLREAGYIVKWIGHRDTMAVPSPMKRRGSWESIKIAAARKQGVEIGMITADGFGGFQAACCLCGWKGVWKERRTNKGTAKDRALAELAAHACEASASADQEGATA